jgi:hypothetical protein
VRWYLFTNKIPGIVLTPTLPSPGVNLSHVHAMMPGEEKILAKTFPSPSNTTNLDDFSSNGEG